MIEASLPGIHKQSRVVAIRDLNDSERSEYKILQSQGDAEVTRAVIAPYLALEKGLEDLPLSSVIVTPANYKFRFLGQVGSDASSTVVFRIVPKKRREGLIRGELWIDSATGVPMVQAGYFVKTSCSDIRRMEIVRDTQLEGGSPSSRITRVALETRRAGRGYLTITEFPPGVVGPATSAGE
jgi:hypothetical protein